MRGEAVLVLCAFHKKPCNHFIQARESTIHDSYGFFAHLYSASSHIMPIMLYDAIAIYTYRQTEHIQSNA